MSDGKGDHCDSEEMEMGFNVLGGGDEIVKSKRLIVRPGIKVWMARAITTVILWTCVVQLMAIGELRGPRLLKGMPYCFSHQDASQPMSNAYVPARVVLPPKSKCFVCHMIVEVSVAIFSALSIKVLNCGCSHNLSFVVFFGIVGNCDIYGLCNHNYGRRHPRNLDVAVKIATVNCFLKPC